MALHHKIEQALTSSPAQERSAFWGGRLLAMQVSCWLLFSEGGVRVSCSAGAPQQSCDRRASDEFSGATQTLAIAESKLPRSEWKDFQIIRHRARWYLPESMVAECFNVARSKSCNRNIPPALLRIRWTFRRWCCSERRWRRSLKAVFPQSRNGEIRQLLLPQIEPPLGQPCWQALLLCFRPTPLACRLNKLQSRFQNFTRLLRWVKSGLGRFCFSQRFELQAGASSDFVLSLVPVENWYHYYDSAICAQANMRSKKNYSQTLLGHR